MKSTLIFLCLSTAALAPAADVPTEVRQAVERFASALKLTQPTFDRVVRGSRGEWRVRWDAYSVAVHPGDTHVGSFMDKSSSERQALPGAPIRAESDAIVVAQRWAANAGFPTCTDWKATLSGSLDDERRRPLWTVEGWRLQDGRRGVGLDVYVVIDAVNGRVSDLFWAGSYTYEHPKSIFPLEAATLRLQERIKEVLALSVLPPVVEEPERRWAWQVKRDQFSDSELPPADLTSRTSRQAYIITVDAGKFGKIVGRVDVETGAVLAGAITSGGSLPPSITAKSDPSPASDESPGARSDDSLPVLPVGVGVASVAIGAFLLSLRRR